MADLLIETKLFSEGHDAKLAEWLRTRLSARGYQCDSPKEKDGFLGFAIQGQPFPLWALVAPVSDEGPNFEWGISVDAKLSPLNPALWGKKAEAKALAETIMDVVEDECKKDAGIEVVERGDDSVHIRIDSAGYSHHPATRSHHPAGCSHESRLLDESIPPAELQHGYCSV
jgi:hypothetical protein